MIKYVRNIDLSLRNRTIDHQYLSVTLRYLGESFQNAPRMFPSQTFFFRHSRYSNRAKLQLACWNWPNLSAKIEHIDIWKLFSFQCFMFYQCESMLWRIYIFVLLINPFLLPIIRYVTTFISNFRYFHVHDFKIHDFIIKLSIYICFLFQK